MKLSIEQISDEGIDLDYQEPVETFDYLKDNKAGARISSPVHVKISAGKKSGGIIIKGHVQGLAEMTCGRCLGAAKEVISHDFLYDCVPERAEEKEELSGDALDICYYSGKEINITPLVQEQVALALPMRPLCKEDCRGLCPICGSNLNSGDCGCRKGGADLRLAALKDIKIK